MSPTTPARWSHRGWALVHAALVSAGLALAAVLSDARPLAALGTGSLLFFVFTERPAGAFGWANAVTLTRLLLLAFSPALDVRARVFAFLSVWALDAVDGALARARRESTPFGAHFDMETDALFVALMAASWVAAGVLGPWALAFGWLRCGLVLARSFFPVVVARERRTPLGRWVFSLTVASLLLVGLLGPGLPSTLLGVGALAALCASFAPDYASLRRA